MSNPFGDWSSLQSILEEVLYRDPSGSIRQLEVRDGATQTGEVITFADGSKLMIAAQVPLPPLEHMTPKKVAYFKLNGEKGERFDDGSAEAQDLARQSVAIRLMETIAQILDAMPECEKVVCPACNGARGCEQCGGSGCDECQGKGACPTCGGHGMVAKFV